MNNLLKEKLQKNRSFINESDECFLLKEYIYNKDIPIIYSVTVPIYNQESIIVKNINSIIKYTHHTFELIIILDYCTDNTERNLIDFFNKYKNENSDFYGVRIFKQSNAPIFETSCDNIGFVNSRGQFCLEIQADMEMIQPGYNLELSKPFRLLDNVFAVSGRCAHNMFSDGGIGKLGTKIEKSISELNIHPNFFYSYETCNRGPLMFSKKILEEINYLDEKNYHLDNSDHDSMIRAYKKGGYICGYVPIDFLSPILDGSTRKHNFDQINQYYKFKRISQQMIKGKHGISGETINIYKNDWINRKEVIYNIENVLPF